MRMDSWCLRGRGRGGEEGKEGGGGVGSVDWERGGRGGRMCIVEKARQQGLLIQQK